MKERPILLSSILIARKQAIKIYSQRIEDVNRLKPKQHNSNEMSKLRCERRHTSSLHYFTPKNEQKGSKIDTIDMIDMIDR